MTTEQVFEEEFDYQGLFKPPENPTPEPEEENLIEKHLKQLAAKELLGEAYVRDYMQDQKRRNCRPASMRGNVATWWSFSLPEASVPMVNPVKRGYALRLSRPLPRHHTSMPFLIPS